MVIWSKKVLSFLLFWCLVVIFIDCIYCMSTFCDESSFVASYTTGCFSPYSHIAHNMPLNRDFYEPLNLLLLALSDIFKFVSLLFIFSQSEKLGYVKSDIKGRKACMQNGIHLQLWCKQKLLIWCSIWISKCLFKQSVRILCDFRSDSSVADDLSLLGYYALLLGEGLLMSRRTVVPSCSVSNSCLFLNSESAVLPSCGHLLFQFTDSILVQVVWNLNMVT